MEKEKQNRTPIFTVLKDVYAKREVLPFHVPGHKNGKGAEKDFYEFMGPNPFKIDVTIFDLVDGLHNPKSHIKEAQELAAEAFGAERTLFCVHGTSGAIQAMIIASVKAGEKILVPRNTHKSINAGIVLSGCIPIYMQPDIDKDLGVAHGVSPETVARTLEEHPDAAAVLVINPTYYGVASDLEKIAEIVHEYDIPLLVDEAHGPHLKFSEQLPKCAMEAGADICCQSTHKLTGAMTQGSMLHMQGTRVNHNHVKQCLSLLQTTSPNYILLASLDTTRKQLATEGDKLINYSISLAQTFRERINKIPGFYSFGEEVLDGKGRFAFDPTKVTVTAKDLGLHGYELDKMLIEKYNIQVELSDFYNVLFITTYGDREKDINKVLEALEDISNTYKDHNKLTKNFKEIPNIPEMVQIPRESFFSDKTKKPIEECVGEISGESIFAYPPGIPVLVSGERITEDMLQYIFELRDSDLSVQGMEDSELKYLNIITEDDAMYIYVEKMNNFLLGVPYNLGCSRTGSEYSIDYLFQTYPDYKNDIELLPIEKFDEDFNEKKLRFLNSTVAVCENLRNRVEELVGNGYRPVTVGGDHSIALGSIAGVSQIKKNIGILWIDAHGDLNTDVTTPTGNIHGMPLAAVIGEGDSRLTDIMKDNFVNPSNVFLFGARDLDPGEVLLMREKGISYFTYDEVQEMSLEVALEKVKEKLQVEELHISFDLDSMNDQKITGVNTLVANGGFEKNEILEIFQYMFENYKVSSVDIVELNPITDRNGQTVEMVADLIDYLNNVQ
ncbi:MAG: aminotransferase class I/II-fold pyridoxal phosphate-dependent enzyme [Fusobacteriaceae bacterium]|nr:aminotransferase class I/II-fold pyridoxal phosphate-dependent enzyme [Fusobacteriaceae bacterium]